ncbi:hypothetical protein [Streptomyces formicae]|uniref:Abortive infection protein n=1 Tax=Streptomyces formicae TaxID=1616117 RepID=A0ABY3WKP0_9ACTN|nr:hypothetical protein [Streptomyces formicae]UNM12176.1 hypothetical protein J4032_12075 [Streptomyces formicae]
MDLRGISYDTDGGWDRAAVRRDLRAIREELCCTAVQLRGADVERLTEAATYALDTDLDVWILPEPGADLPRREVLAHLARAADAAERLRTAHPGRVTLIAGCEYSLLTRGIIPGPHLLVRLRLLPLLRRGGGAGGLLHRLVTRRLRRFLAEALETARAAFRGPVTYAAGFWEDVDWSGYDTVGVNLYRFAANEERYPELLHALALRAGTKPVVVTEFGCGAYAGADQAGPGSFRIVRWLSARPRMREGYVRDEYTQAAYLTELIGLYADTGIRGCFVFTFVAPGFPHSTDPRYDLDMAGFGVVRVSPDAPEEWETKEAFYAVARAYKAHMEL